MGAVPNRGPAASLWSRWRGTALRDLVLQLQIRRRGSPRMSSHLSAVTGDEAEGLLDVSSGVLPDGADRQAVGEHVVHAPGAAAGGLPAGHALGDQPDQAVRLLEAAEQGGLQEEGIQEDGPAEALYPGLP